MADRRFSQRVSAVDFKMKRGTVTKQDGLTVYKTAVATFDTAANDSSGVSNKGIGSHGLGVYLPINAIITKAWYHVKTAFTAASNGAYISFKSQAANDLLAATIVTDNALGTTGMKAGVPTGAAAAMIRCTAERELTAVVATEALVLGKATLFVEYTISD